MTAITICETAIIIENIIKARQNTSLNRYQNVALVSRDYCNRFGVFTELTSVEEVRSLLAGWESSIGKTLVEEELCLLADLVPSTAQEAKTILPNLFRFP